MQDLCTNRLYGRFCYGSDCGEAVRETVVSVQSSHPALKEFRSL